MGKRKLICSLKTTDLRTAQRRRSRAVADFLDKIEETRRLAKLAPTDPVLVEALQARADKALWGPHDDHEDGSWVEHVANRAEAIEERQGIAAARRFVELAHGKAIPITTHIETWLREGNYPPRSKLQHRSTFSELTAWLSREGLPENSPGNHQGGCRPLCVSG